MMEIYCHSDMGKDSFRFEYDPVVALANTPKLLGMELKENGRQLVGGYYLDGSRHPYRKDKLKVFIGRGSVWVQEEGGRCISLPQWLMEYGGAADFKDALRMIKGESQAIHWNREILRMARSEVKYVSKDVLEGARRYDLRKCNLFVWMCGFFGEDKVREAWEKYNVTTDSHGNCVYWYVNPEGRILYDKRIFYRPDGHRDKQFFPARQFRVGDGYSGRCYFGSHLTEPGKKVYVVESEKAVLMMYLMYGKCCVATGGKSNLREVDDNMVLLPDYDARDAWRERGEIWPWWEKWGIGEIPEHSDVADMIEWKLKNRKI